MGTSQNDLLIGTSNFSKVLFKIALFGLDPSEKHDCHGLFLNLKL